MVLASKGSYETSLITGESRRGTVADLSPEVVTPLSAAATEEKIVVDFVLGCRARAIENCWGSAFEGDDDSLVTFICEDMAAQPILFPAEAIGVIKACGNIFPLAAGFWVLVVGVCCHYREVDDGFFVCDVGTGNFVKGPC